MKTNIKLYIEDNLIDLDKITNITITKQLNDIFNPDKLFNDFSKTIKIPNTSNNNIIFGNIWSVNKIITSGSVNIKENFNPSKKAYFKIIVNNTEWFAGYVKLLNVEFITDTKWNYEIALFGELGDFFNKFGDATLKEFLVGTPYDLNTVKLNASNMYNLWQAGMSSSYHRDSIDINNLYSEPYTTTQLISNKFDGNIRNTYLQLIDAENGLYNSGDIISYGSGYNEDNEKNTTKIDNKLTESQLGIKCSYKQRFGFYLDILIATILKKAGYSIGNVNGNFISNSNPYWKKLMITSPVLDKVENYTDNTTISSNSATNSITDATNYKMYRYFLKPNTMSNSVTGMEIATTPVNVSGTDLWLVNALNTNYDTYFIKLGYTTTDPHMFKLVFMGTYDDWHPITELDSGNYYLRVTIKPYVYNYTTGTISYMQQKPDNEIKLVTPIMADIAGNDNNELNIYKFKVTLTSTGSIIKLYNKADSTWYNLTDFLRNKLEKQILTLDTSNTSNGFGMEIEVKRLYSATAYLEIDGGSNTVAFTMPFSFSIPEFTITLEQNPTIQTNSKLKYSDLLPSIKVKDLLVSYLKIFGLYININNKNNTVDFLTRNEFYNDAVIYDWNDKFDNSKKFELNPLNFNSKYIRLSYKDSNADSIKKYKTKYNKSYGEIKLNTGYDFNNDTYELFTNLCFSNSISASINENAYGFVTEPKFTPLLYENELVSSKPENSAVLLFDNGYISSDKLIPTLPTNFYFLFTDDAVNPILYKTYSYDLRNYRNISYIATNYIKLRFVGGDFINQYGNRTPSPYKYSQTSNLYPNEKDIKCSLDFGIPEEQYFKGNYSENSTIYNRFWKAYLEDRYNVNTKVFTGYFYLTDLDINQFTFKNIIYFKNMYWLVNKIDDFDLLNNTSVKVELVSINNIDAIKSGQQLNFGIV